MILYDEHIFICLIRSTSKQIVVHWLRQTCVFYLLLVYASNVVVLIEESGDSFSLHALFKLWFLVIIRFLLRHKLYLILFKSIFSDFQSSFALFIIRGKFGLLNVSLLFRGWLWYTRHWNIHY